MSNHTSEWLRAGPLQAACCVMNTELVRSSPRHSGPSTSPCLSYWWWKRGEEVSEVLTLQWKDQGIKKEPDRLLSKKKEIPSLFLLLGSDSWDTWSVRTKAVQTHVYQIRERGDEIFCTIAAFNGECLTHMNPKKVRTAGTLGTKLSKRCLKMTE